VLVVDDEEPIALTLAEVIAEAGYQVVLASHGKQALEVMQQQQPRLVITDLMMPQLDGRALIALIRMKAYPPERPRPAIILMTAAGRSPTRDIEADAVLFKPFELEELFQLLSRFLSPPEPAAAS
jgi:CheY-like chemotaxis protein